MNVIIIEDEKPSARRLRRMLKALDIEVQTLIHSVEDAINWFEGNAHPGKWLDIVRETIVSYNFVADCGGGIGRGRDRIS